MAERPPAAGRARCCGRCCCFGRRSLGGSSRRFISKNFISAIISKKLHLGDLSPQADRAEARVVHTALVELVKSTNAAMLGPSHERLPEVIARD